MINEINPNKWGTTNTVANMCKQVNVPIDIGMIMIDYNSLGNVSDYWVNYAVTWFENHLVERFNFVVALDIFFEEFWRK